MNPRIFSSHGRSNRRRITLGEIYNSPSGPVRTIYLRDELPLAMDLNEAFQVDNPAVQPIDGMYVAFPDIFRIFPGSQHPDKRRFLFRAFRMAYDGMVAPRLFAGEDGTHFRPIGTYPYIDTGLADDLDVKQVRMATGFIPHGDEIWQCCGGQQTSHHLGGGNRPRKGSTIMRAVQRKDGFAALIAGPDGGEILTAPLPITGTHLYVNYDAGAWGEVRVELLDADRHPRSCYTLTESAPLVGKCCLWPSTVVTMMAAVWGLMTRCGKGLRTGNLVGSACKGELHIAPPPTRSPRISSFRFAWICSVFLLIRASSASPPQDDRTAEEHATRGFQLAEAGDASTAELELRRAIALSPRNPIFLAGLGNVLAMQQKLQEGGAFFEKALKLEPEDVTTRRNLAAIQWQLGDLQRAKANLNVILQGKRDDRAAVFLLGLVEENLKNYSKAYRLLESVPDQVSQHPESIGALANSYYRTAQPEKAKKILEILLVPGTDVKTLIAGGQAALDAGDFQVAEKLFFVGSPGNPALRYHKALLQYRTGRIEESYKILIDLIQEHHDNSATYNLLGWCYHQQGKAEEAVQSFERAIESAPKEESNYLDLATVLLRNGRPLVAQVLAENAIRRFPNSPRIHEMSGLVATSLGQYTDAVKSYARSVHLDPTSPEAHLGLAVTQSEAGMIPEATATFEQGLQRFPFHAGHYAEYGLMLMKRAEAGEMALESLAVRLLEKAIELDPALAEPHYQLGNLALNNGQYERALQHLSVAVKLAPDRSKMHYALGRVYARVGRSQEAADEQQKFATLKAMEDQGTSRAPVRDPRLIEAPRDKK